MMTRTIKKHISLEENEFTDHLEAIIVRDFFPDIPQLQNELEWLEATRIGDHQLIRQAQINSIARKSQNQNFHTIDNLSPRVMMLDEFCASYTGEDNLTYINIMQKQKQQRLHTDLHSLTGLSWMVFHRYHKDSVKINGFCSLDSRAYLTWFRESRDFLLNRSLDEATLTVHELMERINDTTKRKTNYHSMKFNPKTNSNGELGAHRTNTIRSDGLGLDTPYLLHTPRQHASYREKNKNHASHYTTDCVDTPLISWGHVTNTPLWLDPYHHPNLLSENEYPLESRFTIKRPNRREEVARRIANRARDFCAKL